MYFCALCCQEEATSSQESCDGLSSPKPTSLSTSAMSRSDDFCLKKTVSSFMSRKSTFGLRSRTRGRSFLHFYSYQKSNEIKIGSCLSKVRKGKYPSGWLGAGANNVKLKLVSLF